MQQSNILRSFTTSSKLLPLTGTVIRNVPFSPSGCCMENPLQAQLHILQMNDSSHMWSMKWSLLVFVYIKPPSCLVIQSHNKLATSSNKLSSLLPLLWCEESCPVRAVNTWSRRKPPDSMRPKNVTRSVIHQVACPEFLPSPCWQNQLHTKYWGQLIRSRNSFW